MSDVERQGAEFFKFLGVSTLAEARALDAAYIRDKSVEFRSWWTTVIDGKFCIGNANDLYMANNCLLVPMMFGHTPTEFPDRPRVKTLEELKAFAQEAYGDDAGEFLSLCASSIGSVTEMLHKATVSHLEYAIRLLGKAKARTGDHTPIYYWCVQPINPRLGQSGCLPFLRSLVLLRDAGQVLAPVHRPSLRPGAADVQLLGQLHPFRRPQRPGRRRFRHAPCGSPSPTGTPTGCGLPTASISATGRRTT